jgi:tetratricopeptide (TPR) repeat protein
MNETRYKAFISYSHEDAKWADWLQRALESYRVPKHLLGESRDCQGTAGNIAPIFRDRSELPVAADLGEVIREALRQSNALLVICSPAAARSRWVNQEILEFKRLGREHRIFGLIVAGEPGIGERAGPGLEECFPEAMRFRLGTDAELSDIPAEPVAADVRDGKDNRADAKLKIIAGLLGVGFDSLKQRDLHRRHQRLAAFASAASLGVIITSGLAAYAFLAQDEAERQREHAEDLVGFMVGDMRTRLEPIGQTLIMEAVGEELLNYFSSEPPDPSNADMTTLFVQALRLVGEIRVLQNRAPEGEALFYQAMALVDDALLHHIDQEALLFEASQLHFWIADAFKREGDFESARLHILDYLEVSQELYRLQPENPSYKMEVAYAFGNLGALSQQSGDTSSAEQWFERALDLENSLVQDYPDNLEYLAEQANTISWFGAIESRRGSLGRALDFYRQELAIRQTVSARSDDRWQDLLLASAHRWIGWTLSAMGRTEDAIAPQLEAQALYRDLVGHDPDNFAWAEEYYWTQIELAKDEIRLGRIPAAHENLDEVRRGLDGFADRGSGMNTARLWSALMSGFARYYLANEDYREAAIHARRALAEIEPHLADADDYRVLVAYAEAAYLSSASLSATESANVAANALQLLEVQTDDSPELLSFKVLLAHQARDENGASEYLAALRNSDFDVPFVSDPDVESWLNGSTTPQ